MNRITVNAYKLMRAREPYRPTFHVDMAPGPRVKRMRRAFWLTRIAAPVILGGVLIYALLRLARVIP